MPNVIYWRKVTCSSELFSECEFDPMTILPDLPDLLIEHVSVTNEVTVIVRDLPASGRPLHLIVHVRRFFCDQSTCIRKIKASRFPSLTLPRAKFTLSAPFDLLPDRSVETVSASSKKSQDAKTEVRPIQQRHRAKKQRASPGASDGKGRCPRSRARLVA